MKMDNHLFKKEYVIVLRESKMSEFDTCVTVLMKAVLNIRNERQIQYYFGLYLELF